MNAGDLKFIDPDKSYLQSYLDALEEGLDIQPAKQEGIEKIRNDFDGWLSDFTDVSKPVILENGQAAKRVPQTERWLVSGKKFIGRVSVRHYLSEALENEGGYIGYSVRKTERRKGHGRLLLQEGLRIAEELGINETLLTCNDENIASIKIIEGCGGVLRNKAPVYDGKRLNRYYIISQNKP